jgi:hypothetical protein
MKSIYGSLPSKESLSHHEHIYLNINIIDTFANFRIEYIEEAMLSIPRIEAKEP